MLLTDRRQLDSVATGWLFGKRVVCLSARQDNAISSHTNLQLTTTIFHTFLLLLDVDAVFG